MKKVLLGIILIFAITAITPTYSGNRISADKAVNTSVIMAWENVTASPIEAYNISGYTYAATTIGNTLYLLSEKWIAAFDMNTHQLVNHTIELSYTYGVSQLDNQIIMLNQTSYFPMKYELIYMDPNTFTITNRVDLSGLSNVSFINGLTVINNILYTIDHKDVGSFLLEYDLSTQTIVRNYTFPSNFKFYECALAYDGNLWITLPNMIMEFDLTNYIIERIMNTTTSSIEAYNEYHSNMNIAQTTSRWNVAAIPVNGKLWLPVAYYTSKESFTTIYVYNLGDIDPAYGSGSEYIPPDEGENSDPQTTTISGTSSVSGAVAAVASAAAISSAVSSVSSASGGIGAFLFGAQGSFIDRLKSLLGIRKLIKKKEKTSKEKFIRPSLSDSFIGIFIVGTPLGIGAMAASRIAITNPLNFLTMLFSTVGFGWSIFGTFMFLSILVARKQGKIPKITGFTLFMITISIAASIYGIISSTLTMNRIYIFGVYITLIILLGIISFVVYSNAYRSLIQRYTSIKETEPEEIKEEPSEDLEQVSEQSENTEE